MLKLKKSFLLILAGLALCSIGFIVHLSSSHINSAKAADEEWRSDWGVPEGFALDIDSVGYEFPTAIAMVPQPGTGPKDPLYFVTELSGRVKVVTNDHSVSTFAENFFKRNAAKELPDIEGETGLAGICLAPKQGYVFVTFAYSDEQGILHNNIVRFETQPETFSLKPISLVTFTNLFAGYESAISHQIGSCQVADDFLYVSVADGRQTEQSQKIDSLLGKVLRMTLDGQPAPENPFAQQEESQKAENYVWAYGFRNPFGLRAVGSRLFLTDNGSDIDRFLEVRAGENYLWDGTDWSIGSRANLSFSPDIGPVELDYNPADSRIFPEQYAQNFFIAMSRPEMAGVLRFQYSLDDAKALSVPQYFVKYQGKTRQIVVGVALGQDGLYFVPTLPGAGGRSAVYKISYNPNQPHPYLLASSKEPAALMREKGCFGCHQLKGQGGTTGPALDQRAMVGDLETRLNSEAYNQSLAEIDRLNREPYQNYRQAREQVRQAQGEEKLRLWMIYHIMEPRFDNPNSQMPNLGLSRSEATLITDYLLQKKSFTQRAEDAVLRFMPVEIKPRHLFITFGTGFGAGLFLLTLSFVILYYRSRWRIKHRLGEEHG